LPKNKAAVTTNIQNLTAAQPYNNKETRRKILHLLYAFREYFINEEGQALNPAAIKSAQIVANMIDYSDGNSAAAQGPFFDVTYGSQRDPNTTFINRSIVNAMIAEVSNNNPAVVSGGVVVAAFDFGLTATDAIYGYERQPFISEIYSYNSGTGVTRFAVELINPYDAPIDLNGWNVKVGTQDNKITTAGSYVVPAGTSSSPGRLTIYDGTSPPAISGAKVPRSNFGLGTPPPMTGAGNVLRLQRPDPASSGQFLTVDKITEGQRTFLLSTGGGYDTSRTDTNFAFVNNQAYPAIFSTSSSLGLANNNVSSVTGKGYALPVANNNLPIGRLADLESVAFIGNQKTGAAPNTITESVAKTIVGEAGVRFDLATGYSLLNYICTLNRDEGNLPGRININTAPKYVIAAAIPPQLIMSSGDPNTALTLAGDIVNYRKTYGPYQNLRQLLNIPAIQKYMIKTGLVGDQSINNDFEKRDWIISRLSNIFTVRSDTFTAYILVRLGADGPQRRMMAIFDRSNVWLPTDKPKLVALHPVPDPR
jgi:hypothetical protein